MSSPKISDYKLLEKLGSGSFATVYKAIHKGNGSVHAIKCVEKSTLSKRSTDNLITEIKLLRSLSHKNIVMLNDFLWDDKKIYIVLEYCNAGNLSTFIRAHKVLPESSCKYFLRQLASAVQYMRSNDVSHFDLKPQNLLLTKNPRITLKIADFGFAQHLKLGETNFAIKGSPLYMAPEIVSKESYDARADLWSIGVILFECLFGKAPYTSKSMEELLLRIRIHENIVLPANAKISSECEDLLTRLLQHEPNKRINFEEFFNHPFIDLKTYPTEKTLEKAIAVVTKAIDYDRNGNYKEAYHMYCSALQYFVPLMNDETNSEKRAALRNKCLVYLKRAEEIKSTNVDNAGSSKHVGRSNSVQQIIEPSVRYKQLYALSSSSPQLKNALEIGRQGELYLHEKKFEVAFDSLKTALGILVSFINNEPKGERLSLLRSQIDYWMQEAESIKALLAVKDIDADDQKAESSHSSCSIQ